MEIEIDHIIYFELLFNSLNETPEGWSKKQCTSNLASMIIHQPHYFWNWEINFFNLSSICRIQIEGRVVQRAECGPINNKSYMNIKREAITKAGEPESRKTWRNLSYQKVAIIKSRHTFWTFNLLYELKRHISLFSMTFFI